MLDLNIILKSCFYYGLVTVVLFFLFPDTSRVLWLNLVEDSQLIPCRHRRASQRPFPGMLKETRLPHVR